jgi:hypothetical protein
VVLVDGAAGIAGKPSAVRVKGDEVGERDIHEGTSTRAHRLLLLGTRKSFRRRRLLTRAALVRLLTRAVPLLRPARLRAPSGAS